MAAGRHARRAVRGDGQPGHDSSWRWHRADLLDRSASAALGTVVLAGSSGVDSVRGPARGRARRISPTVRPVHPARRGLEQLAGATPATVRRRPYGFQRRGVDGLKDSSSPQLPNLPKPLLWTNFYPRIAARSAVGSRLHGCSPQKLTFRTFHRFFRQTVTRTPAGLRANTRDASLPTPIWQPQAHPPPIAVGIRISRASPIPSVDPVHRAPACCEDVRGCSGLPRLSESSVDVSRTSGSSNPSTPAGSYRSPVRKSHLPSGSPPVIATRRQPVRRLKRPGSWRRSGPDHGSGTCGHHRLRQRSSAAVASSPRSGVRSRSHAPADASHARSPQRHTTSGTSP